VSKAGASKSMMTVPPCSTIWGIEGSGVSIVIRCDDGQEIWLRCLGKVYRAVTGGIFSDNGVVCT